MIEQAQLVSLGKYSWGIAQRLAKPLSVILRHMQELASSHHTPELRESFEAANRMGEFLEELQRKANHDQDFSIGNVNINRVLEEQLAFAELDLETDEEMEIEVSLADDLPLIRGVISDFSQALGNILANAWEALYDQPRKKIHIRTSLEADGSISIAIEDSGRGIDPRILPSIFEPFFTTKPKAEDRKANEPLGTGLGLAIVRLVLEKYEAKCEVKSELGSGTTFLINIPAKYTIIPDGETERDEPVQEKAAVAV
jgi:signal transduction histidine kinase